MATKTKTKTKADVVREILNKIGAVSNDPPEDWKAKTEAELNKRKLKVHQTQIYEIRRKETAKLADANGEATTVTVRRKRRGGRRKAVELNFDSAVKIAKFAAPYGGLAKLRSHIDKIMELTDGLK
jgi:hypothetical protein